MPVPIAMAASLSMDSSDFTSAITGAITNVLKFAAVITAAAIGAIAFFTAKQFEAIDATTKLARELNSTTDNMNAYQLQASLSGANTDLIAGSMRRLEKSLGDARRGLSTAIDGFEDLGVNFEDLAAMNMDDRMLAIADAVQGIHDPVQRAAALTGIFGRQGQKLSLLFAEGSEGIIKAREEIERLTGGFAEVDTAKIEEANDAITRMKIAFGSTFKQIAFTVAPIITNIGKFLTDKFVAFRENTLPIIIDFVRKVGISLRQFIIKYLPIIILFVRTSIAVIKQWATLTLDLFLAIGSPIINLFKRIFGIAGGFSGVLKGITDVLITIKFVVENFRLVMITVFDQILFKVVKFVNDFIFGFTDTIPAALIQMGKNLINFVASIPDLISGKVQIGDIFEEFVPPKRQESELESYLRRVSEDSQSNLSQKLAEFRLAEENRLKSDSDFLRDFFKLFNIGEDGQPREGGGLLGGGGRRVQDKEVDSKILAVAKGSEAAFDIVRRFENAAADSLEAQMLEEQKKATKTFDIVAINTQRTNEILAAGAGVSISTIEEF